MGIQKKLGISKEQRDIARRYCKRYNLHDYKVVLGRSYGKRLLYVIGVDGFGIEYRIRFDKVKRMRSPKGVQVVNKKDYLIHQSSLVHGINTYDYSLIEDKDITFKDKLPIICNTHGVFYKRK